MKYLNKLKPDEWNELLKLVDFPVEEDKNEYGEAHITIETKKYFNEEKNCYCVNYYYSRIVLYQDTWIESITIELNDFEIISFTKEMISPSVKYDCAIDSRKLRRFMFKNFGEEYKRDCEKFLNIKLNNAKNQIEEEKAKLDSNLAMYRKSVQKQLDENFEISNSNSTLTI